MRRRTPSSGALVALFLAVSLLAAACSSGGGNDQKISASGRSTTTTDKTTTTTEDTTTTAGGYAGPAATSTTVAVKGIAAKVGPSAPGATAAKPADPVTVHLGYFPNLTHATAIVGVEKGFFQDALGANKLSTATFNAGPAAVEALLSGAIDATYIGPNPAINAYVKSKGEALRIVSGATSGGALFVTGEDVGTVNELKGRKIATPQLGNTQDVALRYWLKQQGLQTDPNGGGDVSILPQENGQTLDAFKSGSIQGAWVPEPWATRILQDTKGAARVYLDERSLWPNGEFVTTHLIVRTAFLNDHPDVVAQLLEGQIRANDYLRTNADDAKLVVDRGIEKLTGKPLTAKVINAAWKNLTFTNDPIASSLKGSADHAVDVGLLSPVDNLKGIYDLRILNKLLKAVGEPPVDGL